MGQSPAIALLPSALLGPAVWEPVKEQLRDAGHDAVVVGTPGTSGTSVQEVLRWYLDGMPADRDYVLVPHSNAGLYVPAIVQQRSVTGLVLVDAILPPRQGTVTVAPDGLQKILRDLAGPDGRLPVWTSWWPADDVAALFPAEQVRARVSAEQRPFPLSYFAETVTVAPAGPTYQPPTSASETRTNRNVSRLEVGDGARRRSTATTFTC